MRFNKQELITLACQHSHKFNKEGPLIVYEKQDGVIFKRNENLPNNKHETNSPKIRQSSLRNLNCYGGINRVAVERWCRLRGNLLFYLKSKEAWSEPAGLIILEISNIYTNPVSLDGLYPFTVVMTQGWLQHFAASSEVDRDSWIAALQETTYSHLRAHLKTLQEQLHELQRDNCFKQGNKILTMGTGELPFMELSISCDNLRCDGHGWPPTSKAILSYRTPPSLIWKQSARTESVAHCSNPTFLVTLSLWNTMGIQQNTRLRVSLCDVREHFTSTTVLLGSTELNVGTLIQDCASRTRLPLISPSGVDVGFVTITVQNFVPAEGSTRGSSNPQSPQYQEANPIIGHRRAQSLPPRLMMELRPPVEGWLSSFFINPLIKTYRFHSGLGGDIIVHESMLESCLNQDIPSQLLRLWINEEKDLVRELVVLGDMVSSPWQQRLLQLMERHFRRIGDYTQALESVESAGGFFRPSPQKDKSTLQYCPVNLHLQRLWAQNASLRKQATYDCVTVGAFTAIPHGFKGGGLLKLLKHFKHSSSEKVDNVRVAREAVLAASKAVQQLQENVQLLFVFLEAGNVANVLRVVEIIIKKAYSLLAVLEPSLASDALNFYEKYRHVSSSDSPTLADFSLLPLRSMAQRVAQDPTTAHGSDFYSPIDEPEPLDLMRINLKACLLALAGKLQGFLESKALNGNQQRWDIGPGLSSLLMKYEERNQGVHSSIDSDMDSQTHEEADLLDGLEESQLCAPPMCKPLKDWTIHRNTNTRNSTKGTSNHPIVLSSESASDNNLKWKMEFVPSLNKLIKAAQGLLKTLHLVHSVQRLKEEWSRSAVTHSIQHRRDVCFSQALTALVTALVARLCCSSVDPEFLLLLSKIGVLLGVEGLLTPYRAEAGMWSDMAVAVEDLASVKFILVPASASEEQQKNRFPPFPKVTGCRDIFQVTIPVPTAIFAAIPSEVATQGGIEFQVIPIFFNVGINEQAYLADKFGDVSVVNATNNESFERLQNYNRRFQKLLLEHFPRKHNGINDAKISLATVLSRLQDELAANKIQNVAILQLAETAVRKMKGLRITCCKSAKDRTGMAVTLEQAYLLSEEFDLARGEFQRALDCMRSEGTRKENTLKNVGVSKYAFNRMQLLTFPAAFRPPIGTYGNVQS